MDFDIRSRTDFYLQSDRGGINTQRLSDTWRKVFKGIFAEFQGTEFVIHHHHKQIKTDVTDNVTIKVHK
jgi:hypothetical protein